ncbi:MAG: PKD domain-containing protein [Bacteroidota bacterium]
MKKIFFLLALIIGFSSLLQAQVTVHVSGTVTRDSTNLPVVGHEVIISADSNPSNFTFYAQRYTSANGAYDCTIQNVPGGVQTTFTVKTKNCDSSYIVKTFQTSNSPAVENFVICNAPVSCEAGFTAYADSLNPLHIHFLDASTPAGQVTSWHWDFGDGSPAATTHDPWHIYAIPGTYHVCLTIATSTGCTSIKCVEIHIGQPAGCEAHFTFAHDSLNQLPGTWHFFDTSTGDPTAWEWHFGDPAAGTANVSHEKNPTHVYTTSGMFVVCLSIHSATCQSSTCDTILVGPNPGNCESGFTFGPNFLTVSFEGHTNSPYATTWSWNFGDPASGTANFSSEKNPHHIYSLAGLYYVTLQTVDANGCTWSTTQPLYVHATCDIHGCVVMGNTFVDHGQIDLIRIDSGNVMTVVQSHQFGDSLGSYWFGGVAPGHYYLKAQLLPASVRFGDFVPTYFEEAVIWTSAHVIELGQPANPYNFHLVEVSMLSPGNGTIGGTITRGTKVNSGGTPAQNIEVILFDNIARTVAVTATDVSGHFEFGSIPAGTYVVYPEVAGLTTSPAHVIIDNTHTTVNAPFNMTNSQVVYGINDQLPEFISRIGELFPNPPTGGQVSLSVTVTRELEMQFTLIDQTGKTVREVMNSLHKGENTIRFGVTELVKGPYYLKIHMTDGSNIVRRLFIVR